MFWLRNLQRKLCLITKKQTDKTSYSIKPIDLYTGTVDLLKNLFHNAFLNIFVILCSRKVVQKFL